MGAWRARPVLAVVMAVVAVAAAACSGSGGGPAVTFTPSSTYSPGGGGSSVSRPSITPSSPSRGVATTGPNVRLGEKPPVLPASAKADTALGAVFFAQFWMRTLDWGYATTDSTLARKYFTPACTDCAEFMKNFDEPRSKGEHLIGGRIVVRSANVAPNDGRNHAVRAIDVTVGAGPLAIVTANGVVVAREPAVASVTYRLWLARVGGGWVVVQKGRVV